ncbi:MAG: hypothetical protein IKJ02_07855 [Tidjanibacter sp.]|nr:hypothetical protein [Tidjanibacter sp.]
MKKNLFYLLGAAIAMMLIATSCNKKQALEDQVVGKWESTSITLKEYVDGELMLETTIPGNAIAYKFTFNANGTGQIGIAMDSEEDSESITWYVDEEELILSTGADDEPLVLDVISIGRSDMELRQVNDYSDQGIDQSEEILIKLKRL